MWDGILKYQMWDLKYVDVILKVTFNDNTHLKYTALQKYIKTYFIILK